MQLLCTILHNQMLYLNSLIVSGIFNPVMNVDWGFPGWGRDRVCFLSVSFSIFDIHNSRNILIAMLYIVNYHILETLKCYLILVGVRHLVFAQVPRTLNVSLKFHWSVQKLGGLFPIFVLSCMGFLLITSPYCALL